MKKGQKEEKEEEMEGVGEGEGRVGGVGEGGSGVIASEFFLAIVNNLQCYGSPHQELNFAPNCNVSCNDYKRNDFKCCLLSVCAFMCMCL